MRFHAATHFAMPVLAAAMLLALPAAQAAPTFVNGLALDGAALDKSGGTTANTGRIGYFSDIFYDNTRNEWWGLSDRGPGGGTLDYETRVQRFTLDVNMNSGAISNFQVAETVIFKSNGVAFNGKAPSPSNVLGQAFDPEGIVITKAGTLLVSDEYGPSVKEFSRSGELLRSFTTPANLVPRNAGSGVPNFAGDAGNTAGKRTNRGLEGLAISPDGKFAYAMLQSAMLDEGGGSGVLSRIVKFDIASGLAVAQYAYEMKRSGQGQGTSALVAINDTEFYVIERNNRGVGIGAEFATADKEVFRINLRGASDVSAMDLDAPGAVFTKVQKSARILDLDANTLAALGNKSPEKWEGLAIGPRLNNGSYLLLAGSDNDYSVTQDATSGTQYDVYLRFGDADPYASSIQCPLGQTSSCFNTTGGGAATLSADHKLLPGVLHAYTITEAELGVPEPAGMLLAMVALAAMGGAGALRRRTDGGA
jgi:hypothetical protein